MRDGFISVAAGTPKIRVADCRYNAEQIFTLMREADKQGVQVLCSARAVPHRLHLRRPVPAGHACSGARRRACRPSWRPPGTWTCVTAVGLPVWDKWDNKLYNCAAVIQKGEILGLVPKTYLPNYGEFYEQRWFASGRGRQHRRLQLECGPAGRESLSRNQIFSLRHHAQPGARGGDLRGSVGPGAALRGRLAPEGRHRDSEPLRQPMSWWARRTTAAHLVTGQSARLMCGYVYADAGEGESTTDLVFSGHNMIAENGYPAGGAAVCHRTHRQRDRCGPAGL